MTQLSTPDNVTTHLLLLAQEIQWLSAESGPWLWYLDSFVANEFKTNRQLPICPPENMVNIESSWLGVTILVKSSFQTCFESIYLFFSNFDWENEKWLIVSRWADNSQIHMSYPVYKPVCNRLIYFGPCRFQNVHLVAVKFCRLSPRGTGKGLRHLYVVEILRSAPCARSGRKILRWKF